MKIEVWKNAVLKLQFEKLILKLELLEASFNFWGLVKAQVGEASFLEVNLRRKRRRWAYHFYLVRFRPWDPTNHRFWKKTEHFFENAKQDSEAATFQAAARCCVKATLVA